MYTCTRSTTKLFIELWKVILLSNNKIFLYVIHQTRLVDRYSHFLLITQSTLDFIILVNYLAASSFGPPLTQLFLMYRPVAKEELPDGTFCVTQCQDGFTPQGSPYISCNDGIWDTDGGIAFLCLGMLMLACLIM